MHICVITKIDVAIDEHGRAAAQSLGGLPPLFIATMPQLRNQRHGFHTGAIDAGLGDGQANGFHIIHYACPRILLPHLLERRQRGLVVAIRLRHSAGHVVTRQTSPQDIERGTGQRGLHETLSPKKVLHDGASEIRIFLLTPRLITGLLQASGAW